MDYVVKQTGSLNSVAEDTRIAIEVDGDTYHNPKKISDNKYKYFNEETIYKYAKEFNWDLINAANMKDKFIDMVKTIDMSYSYKPVLLKAMFEYVDKNGKARVEDIVTYFIDFYKDRKAKGLVVEKPASIYCKDNYTRNEVEHNIFTNPFKRFEDMRFIKRCKEVEYVEFNKHVSKKLSEEEIKWILKHCEEKLGEYYGKG